jgi:hypothetical protein
MTLRRRLDADHSLEGERMEQQSMGPSTRARRHDRLLHERVHDPYHLKRTLPEPTVCPRCGAAYHQGRWTWMKRRAPAHEDMSPACQRVPDQYPGGFLTLGGRSVQEYEEEILNLVHHGEQERNARKTLMILYEFRLNSVHRYVLLRKMSDWFLRRADHAQRPTGHDRRCRDPQAALST